MTATLTDLAARCEAAAGRDSWLDAEIEVLVRRPIWPDAAVVRRGALRIAAAARGKEGRGWRRYGVFFQHIRYTASLDSAMTLVPKGWSIEMGDCGENQAPWATLTQHKLPGEQVCGGGASICLALCAAALRSRAHQVTP